MRLLVGLLTFLSSALLTHVVTLLLVPALAARDAVSLLSEQAEPHRIELLEPVRAGEPTIPFLDPAAVVALCRFDVTEGPVLVRFPVGDGIHGLTVLTAGGRVALGVSDRAAVRGAIALRLANREDMAEIEAADPEDVAIEELRLVPPRPTGIVVLKALALAESDRRSLETQILKSTCRTELLERR